MIKKVAAILISVLILAGTPLTSIPVSADSYDHTDGQFNASYPLVGGVIGGAGTVFVLVGMSRTKKKATHADHAIDMQNSRITLQEDQYIRTERRAKKK